MCVCIHVSLDYMHIKKPCADLALSSLQRQRNTCIHIHIHSSTRRFYTWTQNQLRSSRSLSVNALAQCRGKPLSRLAQMSAQSLPSRGTRAPAVPSRTSGMTGTMIRMLPRGMRYVYVYVYVYNIKEFLTIYIYTYILTIICMYIYIYTYVLLCKLHVYIYSYIHIEKMSILATCILTT